MNKQTKLSLMDRTYYRLKPYLSPKLMFASRRNYILVKKFFSKNHWPINETSKYNPPEWGGWPEGKKFALVLTHDVESQEGYDRSIELAKFELNMGFRSAFYFVPEKYSISSTTRNYLVENGFEVGVHGLKHDGKLYFSKKIFDERATKINQYLKEWNASGFRSPAMHHELQWLSEMEIEYDASTFDTEPFEPQSDGMHTIFPFIVKSKINGKTYVELPYTLPQDSTLYLYLGQRNIDIWKKKMDWVVKHGGMVMLITHPDYMNFENKHVGYLEYPFEYYRQLLNYILEKYKDMYWLVLPKNIATFWKENC